MDAASKDRGGSCPSQSVDTASIDIGGFDLSHGLDVGLTDRGGFDLSQGLKAGSMDREAWLHQDLPGWLNGQSNQVLQPLPLSWRLAA